MSVLSRISLNVCEPERTESFKAPYIMRVWGSIVGETKTENKEAYYGTQHQHISPFLQHQLLSQEKMQSVKIQKQYQYGMS
jgi:hypothetical protein